VAEVKGLDFVGEEADKYHFDTLEGKSFE